MKSDKELYRQLRTLSREDLWNGEVARFDQAAPRERVARVAVIRAVGVAFAGAGSAEERERVRTWLRNLLKDPEEKVRRYAMTALPKLGAGERDESELLHLLRPVTGARERRSLGRALNKIGGRATLDAVSRAPGLLPQTELKVRARVTRQSEPCVIRLDRPVTHFRGLCIRLRCRRGLEDILRDEVEEFIKRHGGFRLLAVRPAEVVVGPLAPFTLGDLYALRCFATLSFELGALRDGDAAATTEAIAAAIASPLAHYLLTTFSDGAIRYRIEFMARGHQRAAIQDIALKAYQRRPEFLNDANLAPWSVDIHPSRRGDTIELRPRLYPDPRLAYRKDDVPAASHPPLAACMARIAGRVAGETVWDPFCGSGLELIECALRGGVRRVIGTDLSPEAIDVARENFHAARLAPTQALFTCCDFRAFDRVEGLGPRSVTLIVTNPPMGRRIRMPDPRGFFSEFFRVASAALRPGGRLVFPNPLRLEPADYSLRLRHRQVIDLGGFDCRLEVYVKSTR